MSVFEEYLYIDYENVQDVKVDVIKKTIKVTIIVGADQTKVPIDLVQKTQPFGNTVEWIRVNGKGRNALDFFIAFFLGKDVAADGEKTFIIYSKDNWIRSTNKSSKEEWNQSKENCKLSGIIPEQSDKNR
jgi:predicted proteasome-type protease